jgi:hypothetical protein
MFEWIPVFYKGFIIGCFLGGFSAMVIMCILVSTKK